MKLPKGVTYYEKNRAIKGELKVSEEREKELQKILNVPKPKEKKSK